MKVDSVPVDTCANLTLVAAWETHKNHKEGNEDIKVGIFILSLFERFLALVFFVYAKCCCSRCTTTSRGTRCRWSGERSTTRRRRTWWGTRWRGWSGSLGGASSRVLSSIGKSLAVVRRFLVWTFLLFYTIFYFVLLNTRQPNQCLWLRDNSSLFFLLLYWKPGQLGNDTFSLFLVGFPRQSLTNQTAFHVLLWLYKIILLEQFDVIFCDRLYEIVLHELPAHLTDLAFRWHSLLITVLHFLMA